MISCTARMIIYLVLENMYMCIRISPWYSMWMASFWVVYILVCELIFDEFRSVNTAEKKEIRIYGGDCMEKAYS